MKQANRRKMKFMLFLSLGILIISLSMSTNVFAGNDTTTMKKELESLKEQMEEMDERLNETELHSATDKVSFGLEFRTKADSIHYQDVSVAPSWLMNGFFGDFNVTNYNMLMGAMAGDAADFNTFYNMALGGGMIPPGTTAAQFQAMLPAMMTNPDAVQQLMPIIGGFNGATKEQAQALMGMMAGANIPVDKYDTDNDVIYTNRFRLNMKAKISQNLKFAGRLAMYKVFGDSSGVKMMTGSLGDINLDGNTSSLPHGDTIHVERAYFNYKNDVGNVPVNLSLGRRPATEGLTREYGNYSLEGGSPAATIINWQFDGASLNFGLEDTTGIPGAAFKLCYGVGFESDYGNSYSNSANSSVKDATFGGFIATLFDNDESSVVVNYAHAWNITDGFTGTVVMPFIPTLNSDGTYTFTPNTGGYISRTEAARNIGDFDLATLVFRTNFAEYFSDIDFFIAPSWSHTDPSNVSGNPYYGLMGHGLVSTADADGNLESHDGYSVYTGVLFPMPFEARLGLEYNWGSEYWINMTGAEDSLIASKLAARGNVYEAYYIQPVYEDNFFVKLGGQYYDYEYTGSGNPLGAPVKIDDITALDAFFPVVDTAWNAYLSATVRF